MGPVRFNNRGQKLATSALALRLDAMGRIMIRKQLSHALEPTADPAPCVRPMKRAALLLFSVQCSVIIWGLLLLLPMTAGAATVVPKEHWAFQPVRSVDPPDREDSSWAKTPIDRFILAKLESAKLKPSAPATREQLIRRVSFGLIGLPPTPEEIDAFVNDRSPSAYEKLIDRLLASPHYGERWARHWLDLARYAESDGFEHDAVRPHSWRYRDYVIRAFNDDKPYDRFIREQIAGDELWPDDPEALIATGFNLLGPDMVDSADQVQRRLNTLNDMTDTTASAFLGLTLGCARCHDHKFEPFSQRDYYQPAGVLRAGDVPARTAGPHRGGTRRARGRDGEVQRADASRSAEQIDAIEAPYRETTPRRKSWRSFPRKRNSRTRRRRNSARWSRKNQCRKRRRLLKITDAELAEGAVQRKTRRGASSCSSELKKIPKPRAAAAGDGAAEHERPAAEDLRARSRRLQQSAARKCSRAFRPSLTRATRQIATSGRSDTSDDSAAPRSPTGSPVPDNPLTARVMVNRIWQHHFGRGLVATPSDFGTRGAAADASRIARLAGRANSSRAAGASSRCTSSSCSRRRISNRARPPPEALARDPENKLFSRQNRLRLEGEVIRDSLLAISGQLNPQMGGPSVFSADSRRHHEDLEELDAERGRRRPRAPQHLHFRAAQSAFPVPRSVRRAGQQPELSRARAQHHRAAIADAAEFGRSDGRGERRPRRG